MTPDFGRTLQHGQGDTRVHPADRPMAAGRVLSEGSNLQKMQSALRDIGHSTGGNNGR